MPMSPDIFFRLPREIISDEGRVGCGPLLDADGLGGTFHGVQLWACGGVGPGAHSQPSRIACALLRWNL